MVRRTLTTAMLLGRWAASNTGVSELVSAVSSIELMYMSGLASTLSLGSPYQPGPWPGTVREPRGLVAVESDAGPARGLAVAGNGTNHAI